MATSAYCIGRMLCKDYPIAPFTFKPQEVQTDDRTADDIRQQMETRLMQ